MEDAAAAGSASAQPTATMVAKYGKQKIEMADLPAASTTVGDVKELLREKTGEHSWSISPRSFGICYS